MVNTLYEIVSEGVRKYSKKVAYALWRGEEITYEEAGKKIEEVKECLRSAGLEPGDKVALFSSNTQYWGICYFAVTCAGYVAVPILPDFASDDVENIIKHSEAKALFVSDKLFTKISKETLDSLNIVIRTKNLSVISQSVHSEGTTGIPSPEDLAAIIYTSGTTSRPKGVMLTHAAISSQMELVASIFRCYETDVLLSVLPLSHTYECTLGMIYQFYSGSKVVYIDKAPTVTTLAAALKEIRPTVMIIVPLIIEKVYKSKVVATFTKNAVLRALYSTTVFRKLFHRLAGRQLMQFFGGRIRFLGIGGSKLDTQAEKFLYEAKFPYAIGYGLTETAPLLAGAVGDKVRIGSTGPILKGIEYRLENVNEETKQGELVVKTPSQMTGYYKNEEATREVFTEDGFFRTGDLGYIEEDGWLHIKGRLKNMIVGANGENIYPEDIESVLNNYGLVAESVVTEQDGRLVALVHFDKDAVEARYKEFKASLAAKSEEWSETFTTKKEEWGKKMDKTIASGKEEWNKKMDEFSTKKEEWNKFMEQTLSDIKKYVNERVSTSSRVDSVVEEKEEFIKTPTKKIKRFLYTKKG